MYNADSIYAWRLWQQWIGGSSESTSGAYGPDDKPSSGLAAAGACRKIAVRMFGKDAEGETATITIIGWNRNGPGQVLWRGEVELGSVSFDETVLSDTAIPAGAWLEVDSYDSSAGSNACGADVQDGDGQAMLIIRTLGYTQIDIRAENKDGTTDGELLSLVAIYRPYDGDLASGA